MITRMDVFIETVASYFNLFEKKHSNMSPDAVTLVLTIILVQYSKNILVKVSVNKLDCAVSYKSPCRQRPLELYGGFLLSQF